MTEPDVQCRILPATPRNRPSDLGIAVDLQSVEAVSRLLPPFPAQRIGECFQRHSVCIDDLELIPRNFSKYFAVMEALSGGILANKRILDVGCGLGVFVSQAKHLGMIPTGIDIFVEYNGACHQAAMCIFQAYGQSAADSRKAFVYHDITTSPFSEKEFDFVTSFGMLEHIHSDKIRRSVVLNMMKSLAPGGSLILVCGPNKFFPIDLHHYGPKFVFYHCLPVWGRRLYLRSFAKPGQCKDPRWLNGMSVAEIKKHIFEAEPHAQTVQAFPLWVRLARSKWLQSTGVRVFASGIASLLSALHVEPVVILIATRPLLK